MSILKFIWGLLRKLWGLVDHLVRFLVGIFSSVLSWVLAGIVYLLHLVFSYVGDFFSGLFEDAAGISLGSLEVPPLAHWLASDLIALDVAWECLIIYFTVWIATRVARASFSVVRLVIDLL